jgi:hypothetical protein
VKDETKLNPKLFERGTWRLEWMCFSVFDNILRRMAGVGVLTASESLGLKST